MTEKEAIWVLKDFDKQVTAKSDGAYQSTTGKMACDMAISALEEIQQYRALGTVEELREAREKQRPKKPVEYEDKYYGCPACGNILLYKWVRYPTKLRPKKDGLPYCLGCGQAIDWSD